MDALKEMDRWVQQYKDDEAMPLAQLSAIHAMDCMLEAWNRNGLAIKTGLKETSRMLDILKAFQGKLALLDCQINGPEVYDDNW